MATYYVDPSSSTNGVGTEGDPFNALPANFSSAGFINGDVFLFKRGTKYTANWSGVDGDCFTVNRNITFKDYGTGEKPIITGLFTGSGNGKLFRCYNECTFQNLSFRDISLAHVIYAQTGIANFNVLDCEFYNVARTTQGLFHNALTLPASGAFTGTVNILRNVFNGIGNDAMIVSCTGKITIADNFISNVSLDTLNGDCIAVSGDCSFLEVYKNKCNHANKNTKQCFIQDGGSTGYAVIYDNIFEGFFEEGEPMHTCFYLTLPGKVTRNIFKSWRSTCFAAGPNIEFNSNLILCGNGDSTSGGIWSTQTSLLAYNNTIVMLGTNDISKAAISISQSNANIKFKNNVIIGFNRGIVKGTLAEETNNSFWRVTYPVNDGALAEVSKDVSDLIVDPQLSSTYVPKLTSPLINVGLVLSNKDVENKLRNNPPTIGAYEYVARGVR